MFYLPESEAGKSLREFIVARGWDAKYHHETNDQATTTDNNNDYHNGNNNHYNHYNVLSNATSNNKNNQSLSVKRESDSTQGTAGINANAHGANVTASDSPASSGASSSSNSGSDYTLGAVIGEILDFKERDWLEWLGVTQPSLLCP